MMDAYEALITRMSPIELGQPAPDAGTEAKILAAALRAPDHGRLKPWRFLLIRGEGRNRLGDIMAEALKRRDPNAAEGLLERERQKPLRAPLIIVAVARVLANPKIPAVEQLLAAGAAAQNIMLAAHALGFGATWKTGDAVYDRNVKEALGLAPTDEIVGFMYIGTPKAMPNAQPPIDQAVFVSEWPAGS